MQSVDKLKTTHQMQMNTNTNTNTNTHEHRLIWANRDHIARIVDEWERMYTIIMRTRPQQKETKKEQTKENIKRGQGIILTLQTSGDRAAYQNHMLPNDELQLILEKNLSKTFIWWNCCVVQMLACESLRWASGWMWRTRVYTKKIAWVD